MGVNPDHILHFTFLGTGNDKATVQLEREDKSVVSCRGGIKEFDGDGQGSILSEKVPLKFTRLKHELARLFHTTESNAFLLQCLLGLDHVVSPGDQKLNKGLIGIFIGNYPSTKHVRVDIEGLGDSLSGIRVKTDGSEQQGIICPDSRSKSLSEQSLKRSGDFCKFVGVGQSHNTVRSNLVGFRDSFRNDGILNSGFSIRFCPQRSLLGLCLLLLDLNLTGHSLLHLGTNILVHGSLGGMRS